MKTPADASLIALRLPAGAAWLEAAEDVWDAGDAILPLPAGAPDEVVAAMIQALRPAAVVSDAGVTAVAGAAPVARGTAAVVATSGSTGEPNAAVLSWAALETSARATVTRLGVGPADRWLACVPLHHIAGIQVVIRSRVSGTVPVVHAGFSVEAVAAQRDVTVVSLVPTMLRRLLDAEVELGHLRCVLLGGAAAGPQLLDDAAAAGVPVVTTYGMTETSGGCVYDGVPLDDVEVAVAADGAISIRGPVLFSGYRLREDLTASRLSGGWLRTGDLGRWSDDGRLEVLGRADDVIITGGEKVGADWLAGLLERHPAVAEAAVVGKPDAEWGQRVVAFVVARGIPPSTEELRAFVRSHAPAHAAPRDVVVVADLPRLASGKVDRRALE